MKKLVRVKEVDYDITNGKLVGIPGLHYNKLLKSIQLKTLIRKRPVLSRLLKKENLKRQCSAEKETK